MPPPNRALPFLACLPANTQVEVHVAAFITDHQRVTVIVPGVAEQEFEGKSTQDGQTTPIGGAFRFTTPGNQLQAECWNEQSIGGQWINYTFVGDEGDSTIYQLPFSMRGAGTILYFAADPTPAPPAVPPPPPAHSAVRDHILWMWNNNGVCMKPKCVFYVVEALFGVVFQNGSIGPMFPFTFRGFKSAHDCVQAAKDELAQGHRGMAIAWLQAGQLHNPGAQQLIGANADEALRIIANL